jgi:hypothetical protein
MVETSSFKDSGVIYEGENGEIMRKYRTDK